jgi:hypothetical protein
MNKNQQKFIDVEKYTYILDKNYTAEELKDMLRKNNQIITKEAGKFSLCKSKTNNINLGIADGMIFGPLIKCSKCGSANLKCYIENIYYCPGYYDDDTYKECSHIEVENIVDEKSKFRMYTFF